MSISNEQLDYKYHLNFYNGLGNLTGNPKADLYWHQQAEYMHALSVSDAIRDVHLDAATLSHSIKSPEANFQLRFGIARRAKFIWLSLRGIISLVHPERTEPLPNDQVEEVARDLNVIYINIRGALDNFAWFLIDMFGDEKTRKLNPMKVSLFGDEFLKDKNMPEVTEFMSAFTDWNKELGGRRNPAAHRIPLSVPPAFIDSETREEYDRISKEYADASNDALNAVRNGTEESAAFEKADALYDELQSIGKFLPVFVHHPDDGVTKIYPTVPEDIGQLVKVARGLFKIIQAKC